MKTPFEWLSERVRLERSWLRWAAGMALTASVLIIVTGAIVRVTGSGLGCDTWPNCSDESLTATAEMGVHGAIEFGNRLLAIVLCVVVGWLIVCARLQREPVPHITRWAWAQFWVIVLNACVGGVTVWMELSPYLVSVHLLTAMLLLTTTAITWHLVRLPEGDTTVRASTYRVRSWGTALVATTGVLIVLGTIVTGTGPHAGDSAEIARMPFNWTAVTVLHAVAGLAVGLSAVGLWLVARNTSAHAAHRRAGVFLAVFAAQGVIGLVQVAAGLPEAVIVLHLFGSALVWIGAVRIYLDTRLRPRCVA